MKTITMMTALFIASISSAQSLNCQVSRIEDGSGGVIKKVIDQQRADFVEAGGNQAVISKTINDGRSKLYYFATTLKSDSMVEIQVVGEPSKNSPFSYVTRARDANEITVNFLNAKNGVYGYLISCRFSL